MEPRASGGLARHDSLRGPIMPLSFVHSLLPEDIRAVRRIREDQGASVQQGRLDAVAPLLAMLGESRQPVLELEDAEARFRRAEQNLIRERQRLYSLLDALPAYVHLQTPDYRIVFANKYFKELLGDWEGRSCHESFHDSATPCPNCPADRILRQGGFDTREWRMDNGRTFQVYNYPFTDVDGSPLVLELGIEITDRKEAERELLKERQLFVEGPTMVFRWLPDGGWPVVYVSPNVAQVLGYAVQDLLQGRPVFREIIHPEDLDRVDGELRQALAEGETRIRHQYRLRDAAGEYRWIEDHTTLILDAEGRPREMNGYLLDNTERVRAEQALRESEARCQFALDGSRGGVWDWDLERDRVFYSKAWKAMLGHEEHEISDQANEWESRIHPEDYRAVRRDLVRHLAGESEQYENEHRLRRKDGDYIWVLDRGMVAARDEQGRPLRVIGAHTDITDLKRIQERLEKSAATDDLTGLANRRHFLEVCRREQERCRRRKLPMALLMIDVDHFKDVNDTLGHDAGDEVLRRLAATIPQSLRRQDLAGRLGGEEFAVLLPEADVQAAMVAAERIRASLQAMPLDNALGQRRVTVSIGAAASLAGVPGVDALLGLADEALYRAKRRGRNRVESARTEG